MPQTAASVEASIRKLGFKPEDIRLLLVTHARVDHAGATAHFRREGRRDGPRFRAAL